MDFGKDDAIVSEAYGQGDPIVRPVGVGESVKRAGEQSLGVIGRALTGLFNGGEMVNQAMADNLRRDPRPEARAAADQLDPFGAMMGAGWLSQSEIPETANAYRASKIASLPGAVVEVPASMLTSGIVSPIASGLAGLGTLGAHMMGLTDAEPAQVVQNVQKATTYEPTTPAGKEAIGAISYPFEKLAQIGRFAGEHVQDATGSPVAAAAVDTAINFLPYLAPGLKAKRGVVLPGDTIRPEQVDAWTRENPEPRPLGGAPSAEPSPQPAQTASAIVPQGTPFTEAEFWQPGARSLAAPPDVGTNVADAVTRALTGQTEPQQPTPPTVSDAMLGAIRTPPVLKPALDDFLARALEAQNDAPEHMGSMLGRAANNLGSQAQDQGFSDMYAHAREGMTPAGMENSVAPVNFTPELDSSAAASNIKLVSPPTDSPRQPRVNNVPDVVDTAPANMDVAELSSEDLTPKEQEAFDRQRSTVVNEHTAETAPPELRDFMAREGEKSAERDLQRQQSIQSGEADADRLGLRSAVDAALGNSGIKVNYVRDESGLPASFKLSNLPEGARRSGLYDPASKQAYVFTGVANTPEHAAFSAAHEIAGHHGLRALVASRSDIRVGGRTPEKALNAALDLALQNPTVAKIADSMSRQRGSNDRYRMAEEAIADLAGATRTGDWERLKERHGVDVPESMRGPVRSAIANFIERIKQIIAKLFGKVKFTDAQVRDLIQNAWQAAKESMAPRAHDDVALDSVDHGYDAASRSNDVPPRKPGETQADYAGRVLRKNRPAILKALDPVPKEQRIGRANFREMLATRDRNLMIADYTFDEARKMFDRDKPEQNLATIDQWETGQRIVDPDARQFFESLNDRFANLIDRIRRLDPNALHNLIENYFPHIWQDPSKARAWYETLLAKNPIRGDRSFLKQRTYGTLKDGMAAGLKPISTNPVDLAISKLQQIEKYATFLEFRDNLRERGYLHKVEGGRPAPEGYARVDDPAFSAGRNYWAVPSGLAQDINNYLSPGLNRVPGWRALRKFQNTLVSARLGWSMFHAGFTSFDNLVTHADVGMRRLFEGDLRGGLQDLMKAFASPITSPFIEGPKLEKIWTGQIQGDPATAAILNALQTGGARLKMAPTEYNNSLPRIGRAWRQKSVRDLTLGDALSSIGEAGSWVIHHWLVPKQKMAARVHLMKYMLDHFADALGKERGDYLGITQAMRKDSLQQLATHVVDIVDDRLGQMTYDNQFWNRILLQAAQTTLMAPGWLVGTTRTVTGGIADIPKLFKPEALLDALDKAGKVSGTMPRVSMRFSGLITLAVLMSAMNAITQYLLTGKGPSEIKDYFFPKDGNKNADDSDARVQYPTYWMDHYKLATEPVTTMTHKLNPTWSLLHELYRNHDFYETEIRHPNADIGVQAKDIASYLGKSFMPFSVQGNERLDQERAGTGRKVAAFFGVNAAPAKIDRSNFQNFVMEGGSKGWGTFTKTAEEAATKKTMRTAADALRRGETPDYGDLSAGDIKKVKKDAEQPVPESMFERLSGPDKIRAYEMATSAERERYRLHDHIESLNLNRSAPFQKLPQAEQDRLRRQLIEAKTLR